MKRASVLTLIAALLLALLAPTSTPGVATAAGPEVDPALTEALVSGASSIQAILTYDHKPTADDVAAARSTGVLIHEFTSLPMLAVQGTAQQIESTLALDGLVSAYYNSPLEYFLNDSVGYIGADQVQDELGYTGKGVGVAVLDSGVDGLHPDVALGTAMVQNVKILGTNFFTGEDVIVENVPNSDTTSGHGTHVAGTIGGRGIASAGQYEGVAPGASLIGIGSGDALFILFALQGFDYAVTNKDKYNIQVISNSWGRDGGEFSAGDPVNVASKLAYDNGITVVFAAGNSGPGENTLNPYSVAPWVIGVAAGCTTDQGVSDTRVRCQPGSELAEFSSRGIPGDPLYHPTITAPGVHVVAARSSTGATVDAAAAGIQPFCGPDNKVYYICLNGTSMATPHISGVVALMLEAKPGLHPDLVKEALTATARPMERPDGSLYEEWEVGAGYVDAYDAVQKAKRMNTKKGSAKGKSGTTYETYTETYEWSGTLGPGLADAGAAAHDLHEESILADAVSATVRVQWGDPVQDVDLYVKAPDGSQIGSSAQFLTTSEETTFTGEFLPQGTYTVDTTGYLTVLTPYDGKFSVEYVLSSKGK